MTRTTSQSDRLALAFPLVGLAFGFLVSTVRADDAAPQNLKGKRIAILVADGFEEVELTGPRKALDAAGAKTAIVSPQSGQVKAWNSTDWGDKFSVDVPLDEAKPEQFDALLLPGGVMNPDKLRTNAKAVEFVKAFFTADKPVAAICHGPWTLVEADVVRGRKLTSWPSLQTDVRNAGGTWTDSPVVSDRGLVTSRKPADLPAFSPAMVEAFAAGKVKASGNPGGK